jgi:dephospho-CoA kinase
MLVIGLTGNLGCGKSTVARMLEHAGVATIDADAVARDVRDHPDARAAILARFGTVDAAALAGIVFSDAVALRELEGIVHPAVRTEVERRLNALAASGVPIAAVEAIKLLESPLRDRCDAVWVVRCDETDAVARLARDRGMSEAEARRRIGMQSSQDEKLRAADVVIDGSAPLAEAERQVASALVALVDR